MKQRLTVAFAAGRVAFGIGLIGAPGRIGASWLGEPAGHPAVHVAVRGLGARDVALAGGAAWAALSGNAARPWLVGALAGDLLDIGATLAAGDSIPKRARIGTVLLAGASAAAGAALAAVVDE